jgi:hypothetical protein
VRFGDWLKYPSIVPSTGQQSTAASRDGPCIREAKGDFLANLTQTRPRQPAQHKGGGDPVMKNSSRD